MNHSVYILYSEDINKFYIGTTGDIEVRIDQHNNHEYVGSFTVRARDWVLYHCFDCPSQAIAIKVERHVKNMKSRKYLENLKKYPEMAVKLIERYS